jgi:hypothetical protein
VSTFVWTFDDAGSDKSGTPNTKVSLTYNGGKKDLGTVQGSCEKLSDTSWKALPGEVDGAICFYAGAGTEFAVFSESGTLVLKKGALDEGTEASGSVRGDFKVISQL